MDEFAAPGRGFAVEERKFGASFRRAVAFCNSLIQRDFLRRLERSTKSWKWAAHAICNGLRSLLRRKTLLRCILQRERSLNCQELRRGGSYKSSCSLRQIVEGEMPRTSAALTLLPSQDSRTARMCAISTSRRLLPRSCAGAWTRTCA